MKRYFRNSPLSFKLSIIGVVPLAFIVYLAFQLYLEKNKNLGIIENYVESINKVGQISDLIERLQAEQKLSFDYVIKKEGRQQLVLQRQKTDTILKIFSTSKDPLLKGFKEFTSLYRLDTIRQQIDSSRLSQDAVTHFFANAAFRLNTLTTITFEDKNLLQNYDDEVQSQKIITEMLTYLGIIRSNIYNVLITRKYMVETLMGTYPAYDVYKSYEKELKIKAPPQVLDSFNQVYEHSDFKPTILYIEKLFSAFKFDSSYTAIQWWKQSESGLNKLSQLQAHIRSNVSNNIEKAYRYEVRKKNIALLLLLFIIVLVISLIAYTISSISKMLSELKTGAEKISVGQSIPPFTITSNDAIGSLASSIAEIDVNHKQLTIAAGAIGEGNFDVNIKPRSHNDNLANAIIKMKASLQYYIEEIEDREFRFRQLADMIPQIVWIRDNDGNAEYLNKKWFEYAGNVVYTEAIHPQDFPLIVKAWQQAYETGNDYFIEYRIQNYTTKQYRWFLVRAVPIKDAEDRVVKWFGTCTDIHDKKTMQQELQNLVQTRTEELKRSNDDLLRFAHVASHDLKEPLRKVQIFGDRLHDELGDSISEKSKNYLSKILTSSQRLMTMVEGILVYSTLTSDDLPFEMVDVNKIIDNIKEDLEVVMEHKTAIINKVSLPKIKGIMVLIQQLFYNLISNALKFSKENEPPVISISVKEVTGSHERGKDFEGTLSHFIEIKIADNGIGFKQAQAENVFDVFTRLHAKAKFEGTGLGLALCKKIMSRHKGFIYAESEEGKGSVFYLLFPQTLSGKQSASDEQNLSADASNINS